MPSATGRTVRCIGAISALAVLCRADTALASQGPGAGMGTAGPFTQQAMAVLVYGLSALVVSAGLFGALRQGMIRPRSTASAQSVKRSSE